VRNAQHDLVSQFGEWFGRIGYEIEAVLEVDSTKGSMANLEWDLGMRSKRE